MRVRVTSTEELKELFLTSLINNTDKLSKVSIGSGLSGLGWGIGKVGNKALKEAALLESRIFPSYARGTDLDFAAMEFGVSPRFGASKSTTSLRVFADEGTEYLASTHTFKGSHGVEFEMTDSSVIVGSNGFAFIPVRSITEGLESSVDANTINSVSPEPSGHLSVTNDFAAIGGADAENDKDFRARIKDAGNMSASGTVGRIVQALMSVDSDVVRVLHRGYNSDGQVVLAIVTKNGKEYTENELTTLLEETEKYFSIQDIRPEGTAESYGVKYINIGYSSLDFDFRVQLTGSVPSNMVRRNIQIAMSKSVDYRTWKDGGKFEWDNALSIVKRTRGVRYCPDSYFWPSTDVLIQSGTLPRFRQFIMRDMDGNIISDSGTSLNPVYYQTIPNRSYETTIL